MERTETLVGDEIPHLFSLYEPDDQMPNNVLIASIGNGRYCVALRYNYTRHEYIRIKTQSEYQRDAINKMGRRGAAADLADADHIEEIIAELQQYFGALPVGCNLTDEQMTRPLSVVVHDDPVEHLRQQ